MADPYTDAGRQHGCGLTKSIEFVVADVAGGVQVKGNVIPPPPRLRQIEQKGIPSTKERVSGEEDVLPEEVDRFHRWPEGPAILVVDVVADVGDHRGQLAHDDHDVHRVR